MPSYHLDSPPPFHTYMRRAMASLGARVLALPSVTRGATCGEPRHLVTRVFPQTQFGGGSGGRRLAFATTHVCFHFRPHIAITTRAVSNSKKAKKARAKATKSRGGGTGGGHVRSRHGPFVMRKPLGDGDDVAGGAPVPKPVRQDLDMADLRIDSLLNELIDGGALLSNRAKFRALPVDNGILKKIVDQNLCMTAANAGRESRKMRNKGEETSVTKRYALYAPLANKEKNLLGWRGGNKFGTKFVYAATNTESLPQDLEEQHIPEVAFAGRSNVGKSSLINAVTLSSAARSSDVPGKTQSLNFYDVSQRLRVVDMPGYGFAFANDDRVSDWNRLMDTYLTSRKQLKRVYVVVDARHGLKAPDREMLAFLSKYSGVSYSVVLNKTDLVKPADLARRCFLIKEELRAAKRARAEVWMVSTSSGAGCQEFGAELLGMANDLAPGEEEKKDAAASVTAAAAAAAAFGDEDGVEFGAKPKKKWEMDFGGGDDDEDEERGGVVGGEGIPGQPSAARRGRGGNGAGRGRGR